MKYGITCKYLYALLFITIFIVYGLISPQYILSQDDVSMKIDETRSALEQWVETERVISKEKQEFLLAKEMLNERIALVKNEIDSLREKINEAEESIAEADKKRQELIDQNKKLKEATPELSSTLSTYENSTQTLLTRLPRPITDKVKPLSQRLPGNAQVTDATKENETTLSERFQNVIGILNEVNKFNQEITTTSEVRKLKNGQFAEVTALYIGIGQGYYVGAQGRVAGVGHSTDEGWVWQQADDAADQISQAISILENEKVASFVQVPVEIK